MNKHLTEEDIQMSNKRMKASYIDIIRELQIKSTVKYPHLLEWVQSKILTTPNASEGVEQQKLSFVAGGNATWSGHFGKQFGSFKQD